MLLDEIIKLKFLDCIYTSILNFLNKLFILRREQLRVYSHIFKKDDEFTIKLAIRSDNSTDKYIELAEALMMKCKFFSDSLQWRTVIENISGTKRNFS